MVDNLMKNRKKLKTCGKGSIEYKIVSLLSNKWKEQFLTAQKKKRNQHN